MSKYPQNAQKLETREGIPTDALDCILVQIELERRKAPKLVFCQQADGIIKEVTPMALSHVPLPVRERLQIRPELLGLLASAAARTLLH